MAWFAYLDCRGWRSRLYWRQNCLTHDCLEACRFDLYYSEIAQWVRRNCYSKAAISLYWQSHPADHYTMWLINICLASVCIGCYTGWQIHCVHGCRGLHLYFYLLSCTCYSKNNVMFLSALNDRFQRYQGWPGLTKSNGAGIYELTIFIVSPPINTNRKYSLSTIGWMAEWLTHRIYSVEAAWDLCEVPPH